MIFSCTVLDFLLILFGEDSLDGVPDPAADWKGFLDHLKILIHQEKKQWNPVSKKVTPWVDIKKLKKLQSGDACTIM